MTAQVVRLKSQAAPRPALSDESVELVNIRIIRDTFAIVTVRLPAVHLRSLGAELRPDGSVKIKPPRIVGRKGQDFGVAFALQPRARAEVEAAIAALWAKAAEVADGA
jgi:hypothetical protein